MSVLGCAGCDRYFSTSSIEMGRCTLSQIVNFLPFASASRRCRSMLDDDEWPQATTRLQDGSRGSFLGCRSIFKKSDACDEIVGQPTGPVVTQPRAGGNHAGAAIPPGQGSVVAKA